MNKPKMLLSLPNSGSDWVMSMLTRVDSSLRYFNKEYFNPMCNLGMVDRLLYAGFPSELGTRIVLNGTAAEAIYSSFCTNYNIGKEVFGFLNLDWYKKHFDCVVLLRKPESLFPPSRLRVLSWYAACCPSQLVDAPFLTQVWEGYKRGYNILQKADLPIVWYEPQASGVSAAMSGWLSLDVRTDLATLWRAEFRSKQEVKSRSLVVYDPELDFLKVVSNV